MYQKHGWWFPDADTHFVEMMEKNITKGGHPVYQQPVRRASLGYCARRGLALDIGANIGLWSRDLCGHFDRVMAFEPVADFRECLRLNVPAANLDIQEVALGDVITTIDMIITPVNTGHSHVDVSSYGRGATPMITLDSMDLPKIDYIKLDCEGFENKIIQGSRSTIMSHRPIIVIEDKKHQDVGHNDTESALTTLLSWGARILRTVNRDHIIGW